MIAALGDIHFSSSKDYFIAVGHEVLDWFDSWKHNNEDNELILVGDLVQTSVNAGLVIELLYRLIMQSRFRHIHILKGNHDAKLKDGVWQLAYSFLRHNPKVTIYEEPTVATIEGKTVLMLPYYTATIHQTPMAERYSNLYKEKPFKRHFDLVVGHFADTAVDYLSSDSVSNLDKLDADLICLGHIHTRSSNPARYIGSLYANRINENATDRCAWLIGDQGKVEEPLPNFCEFLTVQYPNELPASSALVPIYTVTNCASEEVARTLYGNIFIRKTVKDITKSTSSLDSSEIFLENSDIMTVFNDFLKNLQPPLDRRVASLCVPLVKFSTKSLDGSNRNPTATVL